MTFDGRRRGLQQPGPTGCCTVILDENGVVVKELSYYLGRATNNVAEYEGLLMGLEALLRLGRKNIVVQSDSQLLVCQFKWGVSGQRRQLKKLFQRAVSLLRQFDWYRIVHVRREFNKFG